MPRTVYLARHGETSWNQAGRWQGHTDVTLNDTGREQAQRLGEALRGLGILLARSSDLARARQTAEIAAAVLGLPPVEVDPDLRERAFGCFEGLTRDECAVRFPEAWTRYRADARLPPPGGEAHDGVVARMDAGVRRAAAALPPDGAGLIVSHGGAMRALVASITGELPPPLDNGALFRVELEPDAFGPVTRLR
jgi:broad specificity phosphatase PhoE